MRLLTPAGQPHAFRLCTLPLIRLENDRLRARFDKSGALVSLFDKTAKREVIASGAKANVLAVYHDMGDAWDFAMDYADSTPTQSATGLSGSAH